MLCSESCSKPLGQQDVALFDMCTEAYYIEYRVQKVIVG